jgi:hypothetical protein
MKILFVCISDFANVHTEISRAINEQKNDVQSKVISLCKHPFNYDLKHDFDVYKDNKYVLMNKNDKEWMKDVNILIWCEETFDQYMNNSYYSKSNFNKMMLQHCQNKFDLKIIDFCGDGYRVNYNEYNILNYNNFDVVFSSPDLVRLAMISQGLPVVPTFGKPIQVNEEEEINEDKWKGDEILVYHSPTDRKYKGSNLIESAMLQICKVHKNVKYVQLGGSLANKKNIDNAELGKQRKKFHVYIDQFSSIGGIGMSSFENMSDSIVTMCTSSMIPNSVFNMSGLNKNDCPIIWLPTVTGDTFVDVCNITDAIEDVIILPKDELRKIGEKGKKYVKQFFNYQIFSERYLKPIRKMLKNKSVFIEK